MCSRATSARNSLERCLLDINRRKQVQTNRRGACRVINSPLRGSINGCRVINREYSYTASFMAFEPRCLSELNVLQSRLRTSVKVRSSGGSTNLIGSTISSMMKCQLYRGRISFSESVQSDFVFLAKLVAHQKSFDILALISLKLHDAALNSSIRTKRLFEMSK